MERRLTAAGAIAVGSADKDGDLLARLRAAAEVAKKARVGLFAYGDPSNSDDEKGSRLPGK